MFLYGPQSHYNGPKLTAHAAVPLLAAPRNVKSRPDLPTRFALRFVPRLYSRFLRTSQIKKSNQIKWLRVGEKFRATVSRPTFWRARNRGCQNGIGESRRERVEPFAPMTWRVDGKICEESLKESESGGSRGGLKFELGESDKRHLSLSSKRNLVIIMTWQAFIGWRTVYVVQLLHCNLSLEPPFSLSLFLCARLRHLRRPLQNPKNLNFEVAAIARFLSRIRVGGFKNIEYSKNIKFKAGNSKDHDLLRRPKPSETCNCEERKADGEWLNGSRDSLEEVMADKIQVNYDRTVIVVIGGLMLHGGHVERRERRGSVAPKLRLHPYYQSISV
uniref:Uncharacterized protein n=1 Tax=Ananas comosus var. bracteatus TaxID=296719 RepID=A0A6V7QYH0_ANACO